VGLKQFEGSCINDHQVKELIPKIQMELDPEFAPLGLIGTAPAKLRIVLKDGRTLDGRCDLTQAPTEIVGRHKLVLKAKSNEELMYYTMDDE